MPEKDADEQLTYNSHLRRISGQVARDSVTSARIASGGDGETKLLLDLPECTPSMSSEDQRRDWGKSMSNVSAEK